MNICFMKGKKYMQTFICYDTNISFIISSDENRENNDE